MRKGHCLQTVIRELRKVNALLGEDGQWNERALVLSNGSEGYGACDDERPPAAPLNSLHFDFLLDVISKVSQGSLYFNANAPTAEIHTHDTKLKKRLLEYAAKFPELCQQTDDDEQGGKETKYPVNKIPKSEAGKKWLKFDILFAIIYFMKI